MVSGTSASVSFLHYSGIHALGVCKISPLMSLPLYIAALHSLMQVTIIYSFILHSTLALFTFVCLLALFLSFFLFFFFFVLKRLSCHSAYSLLYGAGSQHFIHNSKIQLVLKIEISLLIDWLRLVLPFYQQNSPDLNLFRSKT